jgi:hypothetical protein
LILDETYKYETYKSNDKLIFQIRPHSENHPENVLRTSQYIWKYLEKYISSFSEKQMIIKALFEHHLHKTSFEPYYGSYQEMEKEKLIK